MSDLQVESYKLTDKVNGVKHELKVSGGLLRTSQHELNDKEGQLNQLIKNLKSREIQRKVKINQLQSIVLEGESSVARVQQSIVDATSQTSYTTSQISPMKGFASPSPRQATRQTKTADKASRNENRNAHMKLVGFKFGFI